MFSELYLRFSNISFDSSGEDEGTNEVCIANISPKERKKRLDFAIQYFIFTILVLAVLLFFDVHPLWRLPLFGMFAASTSSYFQWRDKT
jgi:hypothetical protein